LFKLVEGVATSSFGTHVANLAGVPLAVVERANTISKTFAEQFQQRMKDRKTRNASEQLSISAQADFVHLYKLATGLRTLEDGRGKFALSVLKDTARKHSGVSST
jgi:DNA mismatch repair protein MSH6